MLRYSYIALFSLDKVASIMSSAHSDRSLNKHFLPELLVDSISRAGRPGLPKHIQLRDGVVSLIERSLLKVGDQILPEQQLAVAVRMSLGTVQKALNRLPQEGGGRVE